MAQSFKRILAFFIAVLLSVFQLVLVSDLFLLPVGAEERSGYWKLKETNVTKGEDEIGEGGYASYYYSASELTHTERVSRPKTDYHGAGGADLVVSCSRPPEIINPGEAVEMELSLQADYSGDYMLWSAYGAVEYGEPNEERDAIMYNAGIKFEPVREGDEKTVFYDPYNPTNSEAHVQHVFDNGYDEESEMAILFYANKSNTIWIYGWVDTTVKEAEVVPEGTTGDEGDGSSTDENLNEEETVEEPEEEEEPDWIEQEETSEASETEGQDFGTGIIDDIVTGGEDESSLPEAAVVGAAGALAAAGGIMAGGGKNKKRKKNKKDKDKAEKNYKMFVAKDFGDAIKKGGRPVSVRARIDEISSIGERIPRQQLTENIHVSGDDLIVDSVSMRGSWMEAFVYADENCSSDKGTLTFSYTGKGGVFRNNIVFRLVDKTYIVFPDKKTYSSEMYLDMLAEDINEYSVRFFFENAVEEPEKISFEFKDNFTVKERAAENIRTYYADITVKGISFSESVFAEPVREYIGIRAEFADGEEVEGGFNVAVWPEGLSISSRHIKDGRLVVYTVINKEAGELDYKIRPTDFTPMLCYRDGKTEEVRFLTGEDISARFSDIYEAEKYGNTFTENFRYEVETGTDIYAISPKDTLPMFNDGYDVKMDIVCETEDKEYKAELPIRFMGDKPLPPSLAERKEAIKRLRKTVEEYGIGSSPTLKTMIRNIDFYSASEIEFVRSYVLLLGVHFYRDKSRTETDFGNLCDRYVVVSSAMIKAGDYAVQVLLELKFPGGKGKLAAAFINPFKNMLFEYIGQYIGPGSEPGAVDETDPFMKTVMSAVRDTLGELLTGELKPSPEAMGYVVAAYLMYAFASHYYYGKDKVKGDVYRSVLAAAGDLTFTYFKAWLSDKVKEGFTGPKIKALGEWLGKKLDGFFGKISGAAMKAAGDKAFENSIRSSVKDGIGYAEYELAKQSREIAAAKTKDALEMLLYYSDENTSEALGAAANMTLAAVFNYYLYGVLETDSDDADALGATMEDVGTEVITKGLGKLFGLVPENVYKIPEALTGLSSVKLDGTKVRIEYLGYAIEIDVFKNFAATVELMFKFAFSWMKPIFDDPGASPQTFPDYRDRLDDNVAVLDESLNKLESTVNIEYISQ